METINQHRTLFEQDQAVTALGITDESFETYLGSVGLSNSGLKNLAKTPRHYIELRASDDDETASQRLGTLAHMAILEPARFEETVVAIDGHRGRTDVKAAVSEAEAKGKYVCKPQEFEDSMRFAKAIRNSATATALLSNGKAEQTIRWRNPDSGVLMKARADYLREDGVLVDIKTYHDLSEQSVMRQIHKMKYHWQAAHYLNAVKATTGRTTNMFAHLFIDTKSFDCRVVVLDDASIDKAGEQIAPLYALYSACLKENKWPGYPDEICTVSLPSYAWSDV